MNRALLLVTLVVFASVLAFAALDATTPEGTARPASAVLIGLSLVGLGLLGRRSKTE